MTFTFGIMTVYENIPQLQQIVDSIRALNIPKYEIILAGHYGEIQPDIKEVQFIQMNEWHTKKKNRVAQVAQYDTIVMLHDYFVFDPLWYQAYEAFGYDWDVCSNPQNMIDGRRHFTDWVVWDSPVYPRYYSLPYNDWEHTQYMYQSGGYVLVKRDFLRATPLNESFVSGQPEDVEWSLRMRMKARWVCNPLAVTQHNKKHRDCGRDMFPFYQPKVII